jgi:uncharacterized membrane protein YphA (DoxX/SURF4 family)
MKNNILVASICLLSLYVYSSYGKIIDVNGTAKSLNTKLNILPMNLCILAIYMVIILELFGSLFLVYSIYTDNYKEYAYYTVIAFIGFNILATLLYHMPVSKKELVNSLKNISITGGFILLLEHFKFN